MVISAVTQGAITYGTVCLMTIYGAPVVVWLSGSLEGTTRCIGNLSILAKNTLFSEGEEQKAATCQALNRNKQLVKGCTLLGVISLLPVIGTYYGWKHIYKETSKHEAIQRALERSRYNQSIQSENMFDHLMSDNEETDSLKSKLIDQLEQKKVVSVDELDEQGRHLNNTLIKTYVVYTATHYTAKRVIVGSAFGVKYTYKAVKYCCHKTKELFSCLFKRQLLRRAIIFTAKKVVSLGRFTAEVLKQEVVGTLEYANE